MRIKEIPNLEEGFILKRQMLIALSDAAVLTNEYLKAGYANGILAGCNLVTTEDTISLNSGLIFFEGQIFMIKKPLTVKYAPTNVTMVLKLCFLNEMRDDDCIYREADLKLTEQTKQQSGEIELCRFKLQEGARLRYQYQNFEDMNTEYDTLNIIYTPYASDEESTLAPEIVKRFAREMLEQKSLEEFDSLFCLQILGQTQAVRKEAFVKYIEHKSKEPLEDSSNIQIYKKLLSILRKVKGAPDMERPKEKKKWKLMVE